MLRQPRNVQFPTDINLEEIFLQMLRNQMLCVRVYEKLLAQSPSDFSTSMLERALAYEKDLRDRFTDFYLENFGPLPVITPDYSQCEFDTYEDGLLLSFRKEIEAVSFAKEALYLLEEGSIGRDLFHFAVDTNMEQQIILNTLYNHYLSLLINSNNTNSLNNTNNSI